MLSVQMTKRATAKDIAVLASVSQAAVSYAFSPRADKRGLIAEETRTRILEVAERIGYFPNRTASSIRTGKTGLIALWVPNFTNSIYLRTMRGIQDVAAQHGLDILVNGGTGASGMAGVLRSFGERRVDGAILIARPLEGAALRVLGQLELPLVTIGGSQRYPNVDSVLTRNAAAFSAMVLHLAERGYTRIGQISGPLATPTAQERIAGYRRGLKKAKLPLRKIWQREGTYRTGSAGNLALELARLPNPPDALVVANDLMAIEAILALQDAGIRVPHDMAVVGCDDTPEGVVLRPRLTTIRRPGMRAAQAAMTLLLERMNGFEGAARTVWLEAELVIRESA